MLSTLQTRLHDDEDGFTLIELMVVVLIIAILIAIAIPTFLGVQNKAKDASAKSDLRNGITNAKALATDFAGSTTTVDDGALQKSEPSLSFVAGGTPADGKIGVVNTAATSTTPDSVLLLTKSKAGNWFGMKLTSDGKVTSCTSGSTNTISAGNCIGTDFLAVVGS